MNQERVRQPVGREGRPQGIHFRLDPGGCVQLKLHERIHDGRHLALHFGQRR